MCTQSNSPDMKEKNPVGNVISFEDQIFNFESTVRRYAVHSLNQKE